MNKTNAIQVTWMTVSVSMMALVIYALVFAPNINHAAEQSQLLRQEIASELSFIEQRLSAQIQALDQYKAGSLPDMSPDVDGDADLNQINQQLALILEQQKQYQTRLAKLEGMVAANTSRMHDLPTPPRINEDIYSISGLERSSGTALPSAKPLGSNTASRQEQLELADAAINRQVAIYEERLFEEQPDPHWQEQIQTKIIAVIQDTRELDGVHLADTQCTGSLCKLEVYVSEEDRVEEKIHVLMMNRPWPGESFVTFDLDGEGEIFFAREGHHLP